MIYYDNLTLKAFVEENQEFFTGARIQKIQQPTRRDFILTLRNNSKTEKLYINISPNLHHLCFMSKKNEEKRYLKIPQKPPMFCMLLRKYIENAKISHIYQPPYERILEIYIEAYNELAEKIHLCFAIELMGKHSNVILYNAENKVIIGCAHNVGSEKSRNRETMGMLPYIYPQKQLKQDILTYHGKIDFGGLSEDFFGFSMAFAQQCEGLELETLKDFIELKGLSPVISSDYSSYALFSKVLDGEQQSDVNKMIDNYFSYHQEKELISNLKIKLFTIINHKLKKTQTALEKINKQLQKNKNIDKYKHYGDLIMANLYNLKDYSKSVIINNWKTNSEIELVLDETKTLKGNANHYFKLYNKSKKSSEKLLELKNALEIENKYYAQTLFTIEDANSINLLIEIKQEIIPEKSLKKEPISTIRQEIIEGFTVYIGKNNKQNDFIISKLAKDNDLWFHTKDCPGAHVLLKLTETKEADEKIIFECAKLAKDNSSCKNVGKTEIIYTKRKYLKKPPASNLGYVTYKNEQEILVE